MAHENDDVWSNVNGCWSRTAGRGEKRAKPCGAGMLWCAATATR